MFFLKNMDVCVCVFVCESAEKAQLCLFGSSKNGFGFRDSDLDICMTLEGHDTAEVKADFTHASHMCRSVLVWTRSCTS